MSEILDFFKEIFSSISNLGYPLWITMALVVSVMIGTELLKWPYKALVTNKIKNDVVRHKANLVIWLIPEILGILGAWAIFKISHGQFEFHHMAGVVCGFSATAMYEFVSKLFKRITDGEAITEETIKEDVVDTEKKVEEAKAEFDKLVAALKKTKEKEAKKASK